jgi:hypothetical protein
VQSVSAFLAACALALLFVLGAVFALQPSPRQRQLAALRQAAAIAGLRVRLRHGESGVDYLLPWRAQDLDAARGTDFVARRADDGAWSVEVRLGPPPAAIHDALALLPGSASRLAGGSDGLVACWQEHGTPVDVAAIVAALERVREVCTQPR